MERPAHILVVEDEPHALKWLGSVLEAEGRRTTLAATGEAALAAAAPMEAGLPAAVVELERCLIERALERSGGNKARAAELLRLPRRSLYNKLAEYKLAGPTT